MKKGQAYSRAICAASYAEGGAKKHDYCWMRVVDLKDGVYVGLATYGDAWRDEDGPCTKKSILKILNSGAVKNQILFDHNQEWRVVSDKKLVQADFKKVFEKPQLKIGKYFKYKWQYHEASGSCTQEPGEADREYNVLTKTSVNFEKSENDNKLVLGTTSNSVKSYYYISEEECKKDQLTKK